MSSIIVGHQTALGQFAGQLNGHIAQIFVDCVLFLLVRHIGLVDGERIFFLYVFVSKGELLQIFVEILVLAGVVGRICGRVSEFS